MIYCYIDGKIMPLKKAGISPRDIGFLRGYGVFEYIRTFNGKLFLFDEHFKRLKNSANYLNIKLPLDKNQLLKIIYKLLAKNKLSDSAIRIILTGGESGNGMKFDSATLCVLNEKLPLLPEIIYKKGIKLMTFEYKRELPEIKTLNYVQAVRIYNTILKKRKAVEILYVKDNKVLECSTSDFFIMKKNILITPRYGVLSGTTRNLVIKLAKKYFHVIEREINIKELKFAKEVFITSTSKGIVPVVKIDNLTIGNDKVGENTKKLMEIFNSYVKMKV